jgi:hypothetical protein
MNRELLKKQARELLHKKAFQPMPQSPPPQGGGMPPGGDPSQGGMPPGMPPPGAGAPPQGGMPPPGAGAPPPQGGGQVDPQMLMQMMQDPQVQQMLAQAGIQVTPQGPVDQSGQPVPPEAIVQLFEQMGILPPSGGGAPGGAPGGQDAQGMTPEAAAAGGALGGDPAAGGMPPGGDPAAGGMPPPPDAGGMPPPGAGGTPLTVEAFMELMPQIMEQMKGGGKSEGGGGDTTELESRIDQLEQMVTGLVQQLGVPPSSVGLGADAGAGAPAGAPEGEANVPAANEVAADQLSQAAAAVQPPPGMPVTAQEKRASYIPEVRRTSSPTRIQSVISKLKYAR